MDHAPPKLANQFDIPNALRFEDGPGGLVRAAISTPAAEADDICRALK
jgi:hypothetical protein